MLCYAIFLLLVEYYGCISNKCPFQTFRPSCVKRFWGGGGRHVCMFRGVLGTGLCVTCTSAVFVRAVNVCTAVLRVVYTSTDIGIYHLSIHPSRTGWIVCPVETDSPSGGQAARLVDGLGPPGVIPFWIIRLGGG
jgi:hypothetical protein